MAVGQKCCCPCRRTPQIDKKETGDLDRDLPQVWKVFPSLPVAPLPQVLGIWLDWLVYY